MKREERTAAGRIFREYGATGLFKDWLAEVERIEVELHAGGRATMTDSRTKLAVEARWDDHGVSGFRVDVLPGSRIPRRDLRLSAFVAALELARRGRPQDRSAEATLPGSGDLRASGVVGPAPARGKPASTEYYTRLIAEHEELISEAHPTPLLELAHRHGVRRETVKSQLRRGRRYLEEGTK